MKQQMLFLVNKYTGNEMKEVNATQFKNDYEYRKALQEFKKGERNKRNQRGSKWAVDKSSNSGGNGGSNSSEMNTFMCY